MPNFSSLARLEVPEKFLWWVGGVGWGGVCKVIFMSNPTVVLRLGWGWGFDNECMNTKLAQFFPGLCTSQLSPNVFFTFLPIKPFLYFLAKRIK